MKKILLLTTCLLSGLMAADPQDISDVNSKGACYVLANRFDKDAEKIGKLTRDIVGHNRIALDCQYNAALNAFYTGRNARHMEARGDKIVKLTVELSELEDENSKLLETIRAHPHFSTLTVKGALMRALYKKSTKETKK